MSSKIYQTYFEFIKYYFLNFEANFELKVKGCVLPPSSRQPLHSLAPVHTPPASRVLNYLCTPTAIN